MREVISYYWRCEHSILNFGEHFSILIPQLLGYKTIPFSWDREQDICLCMIGSLFDEQHLVPILERARTVLVWGMGSSTGDGAYNMHTSPHNDRVKLFSLRGNLTKRCSGADEHIPTADPIFFMPTLSNLKKSKSDGSVVYAPHWENRHRINERLATIGANDFFDTFIDTRDIESNINRLLSASFVLCNAMHVLLFCIAFRIPCAPLLLEDEILNSPFKWQDSFDWLGIDVEFVKSYDEGIRWWKRTGQYIDIPDITPALHNSPLR